MRRYHFFIASFLATTRVDAFLHSSPRCRSAGMQYQETHRSAASKRLMLRMVESKEKKDPLEEKIDGEILGPLEAAVEKPTEEEEQVAATGTVNERLLAELEEAKNKEKYGARSQLGKKMGLQSFKSSKTDEERQAAIEEARNLNGVNPLVALGGSAVALAIAAGLWLFTNFLAEFFALHPVQSDVYFVERVTAVFRNVVVGLVSLASGFFGVTGVGIFLLGVRVAYGVITGELDPTPIKKSSSSKQEEIEMPNVWDLMLNKKPGRRGRK